MKKKIAFNFAQRVELSVSPTLEEVLEDFERIQEFGNHLSDSLQVSLMRIKRAITEFLVRYEESFDRKTRIILVFIESS